jgi:hypothetical protein
VTEFRSVTCRQCGATNTVAVSCSVCGRAFVVTGAHLAGTLRSGRESPVPNVPEGLEISMCDYHVARRTAGVDPAAAVSSGLRQRMCPSCQTEILSDLGR